MQRVSGNAMPAARYLAIDRNHLGCGVGEAGDPGGEAGREGRGIEHTAKRIMRRHISGEGQEGQSGPGPLPELDDVLRPGCGLAQNNQQDLRQRTDPLPELLRVAQRREMIERRRDRPGIPPSRGLP